MHYQHAALRNGVVEKVNWVGVSRERTEMKATAL